MELLFIDSCFACFCVTEFMHEDERGLYEKLSHMLNEDEASTVIDLPGKKHTFKWLKWTRTNTQLGLVKKDRCLAYASKMKQNFNKLFS